MPHGGMAAKLQRDPSVCRAIPLQVHANGRVDLAVAARASGYVASTIPHHVAQWQQLVQCFLLDT